MSGPVFTVAIPTKNRADLIGNAVKSVLGQTFQDLEVVVCDNSDAADSEQTAAAVRAFDDPRLRYERTSGQLSMPDNWERAIADARGDYVGILTDRSVFRPDALQVVHDEIQSTGAQVIAWFNDLYGRGPEGTQFKRRACTLKRYRYPSETILDYFLHGNPKYATKIVPKLMTSFCHRSVLDAIRDGPVGRCCPPVAPDFTSGFLMLAHCDWVLTIDECLYVSCGAGNGSDFRRGGELADRFRRDLGMEWHEIVDRMPSDACFSHALVLNDLMRVRDAIPDRLPSVELDRTQYYLGCLNDYVKTSKHGVLRDDDLATLLDALEREPPEIRDRVRETRLFAKVGAPDGAKAKAKAKIRSVASDVANPIPCFDSVFEAMAWDASNPRQPASTSFVDLTYTVSQMKKQRGMRAQDATVEPAATASDSTEPRDHGRDQALTERERAPTRLGTRVRRLLSPDRTAP